jgi:hypothetical protein
MAAHTQTPTVGQHACTQDWHALDWHAHMLACTHGLGMPKPSFFGMPLWYSKAVQSCTYWHISGGEEGMYNRVKELLKGGQR